MKTSDLIVKILEQKGVKTIYGVPGEENLDLLDSIGKSSIELMNKRRYLWQQPMEDLQENHE